MKVGEVDVSEFLVVPEDVVAYCATEVEDEYTNTFKDTMEKAAAFRRSGLSPVFLAPKTLTHILVTSEELLRKRFH